MYFEKLNNDNVELYLNYLKEAFTIDKDMMIAEKYDEEGIRKRINDPFYMRTTSILAIDSSNKVMGRIEYHFYGCMQDGYRMAYVDWVCVLPQFRHGGVAQALFKEFEKECVVNNINQYYLIRATNDNANHFYGHFENVTLDEEPMLRKYINQ